MCVCYTGTLQPEAWQQHHVINSADGGSFSRYWLAGQSLSETDVCQQKTAEIITTKTTKTFVKKPSLTKILNDWWEDFFM